MPRPYRLDLRTQIMDLVDEGMSLSSAAKLFDVAPSTASRWRKRRDLAPSRMGGKRAKLEDYALWLADLKERQPLITPMGAFAELQSLGVEVSYASVRRFMIKHGWAEARPRHMGAD